jgi:hypothetical protein
MRFLPFRFLGPMAAAVFCAGGARAQLSAVSPFLPADGGSAQQVNPNTIEYRGLMSTAHGTLYLLYDPVKKVSVWVHANEAGSPYLVRPLDPAQGKISVRVNGQVLSLTLKEAKVVGSAPGINLAMSAPVPSAANPAGPAPGVAPIVLNPTAADEQRRLQMVADEVRRRRLAREQAAQQQSGGAP